MRLLIAGGGTGGHLFPALAVAQALMKIAPKSQIMFVGAKHGIEAKIIPQTEFSIKFVKVRGLRKTGILNKLVGFLELPFGLLESMAIIHNFKPDFVLGVGGYASGPALAAAVLMRISCGIQEQNSVMGTTNKAMARWVDKIFVSWEKTEPATAPEKTILTGNPIREDLTAYEPQAPEPQQKRLLIFGGSRGARAINDAIINNLDQLQKYGDELQITHQTGSDDRQRVAEAYESKAMNAEVIDFISEMGKFYNWADLVVCRAGASSLAELTALGKAAIVIPYPYAVGDHQAKNACALEEKGALKIVYNSKLKNGALVIQVQELLDNPDKLKDIADKAKKMGKPQAARSIASEILKTVKGVN